MNLVTMLFVLSLASYVIALLTHSLVSLVVCFLALGLGYGGTPLCVSAFAKSNFGGKYYAINYSIIGTNLIFASFGSIAAGALFDATHSYMSTAFLMVLLLIAAFLFSAGVSLFEKRGM